MQKNILAIQLSSVIGDYEANKDKVKTLFLSALNNGCKPDIVFLPEVWTLGWYTECFRQFASKNSGALHFLCSLAKEYNVNIIGGSYVREVNGNYYNSCPVIDRNGNNLAFYDKIHLYSPDGEAKAVLSGDTPLIADIEGLKIGLSICYDIRFPELFRSYIAASDAPHLMVNLSAWPKTRRKQYDSMAHSRAVENQSYFLALSQTGLIKDDVYNSGCSVLVAPLGDTVAVLNEDEGYIYETVDTAIVSDVRNTYPNLENRKVNDFGFSPKIVKAGLDAKISV